MEPQNINRIIQEVVQVVNRSGCSKCGSPKWGNPERLRNVNDIPSYLRWHHKDRQLCDASAVLEKQYQALLERPTQD